MQVSTVLSRAPAGLEAPLVRVEVQLGTGLPAFFELARTCADLPGETSIRRIDVAEAVRLRSLDRSAYLPSETI